MRPAFATRCRLERVLLIVMVLCTPPADAGVNTWTSTGPQGGATINVDYHPTRPGVAYAAVADTFYRSANGGLTWIAQPHEFANSLGAMAMDPSDGDVIYVCEINNVLWRSIDQGATFTRVGAINPSPFVAALAIARDGMRLVAAVYEGRLLVSDDRGASWNERTPTVPATFIRANIESIVLDPIDRDIIYAGMRGVGVFKTSNAGGAWSRLNVDVGIIGHSIVIDPNDRNHVIVAASPVRESRDAGANWNSLLAAGSVAAFDPRNSQNLFVGSIHNAVFKSSDGGATWQLLNTDNGVTCGWFASLRVDPNDSNRLLGGGDEGICRSDTSGDTWAASAGGVYRSNVTALRTATGAASRATLVGLSPGPAYVSSNVNGPWKSIDRAAFRAGGAPSGTPVVGFVPGTSNQWFVGIRTGGLLRITEGAPGWQGSSPSVPYFDLVADPSSSGTFYAATLQGIYKSIDGGAQFTSAPAPAGFLDFASVEVDPANPLVIYGGSGTFSGPGRGVAKSIDGGQIWTAANAGLETTAARRVIVDPTDSNRVYVATGLGLYVSLDAARTWTVVPGLPQAPANDVALDPSDPRIIYAGGLGLFRSVDRGQTWETVLDFQPDQKFVDRIALDNLSPHIVYVGVSFRGLKTIEIAPDLSVIATPVAPTVPESSPTVVSYEVRNLGPFSATSVALGGTWSTAVEQITFRSTRPTTCSSTATSFQCAIGILSAGSAVTVLVDYTPRAGSIVLNASVSGHESDGLAANNVSQAAVTAFAVADVSVAVTAVTSTIDVGQTSNVTTRVANAGPSAASDIVVSFPVGQLLGYSSVSSTQGSCTTGPTQVDCFVGALASGASATITFTATGRAAGSASVSAQVASSPADITAGNNTAAAAITVRTPPAPPPPVPPPPSSGGGGGGRLGFETLLGVAFVLLVRRVRRRGLQGIGARAVVDGRPPFAFA